MQRCLEKQSKYRCANSEDNALSTLGLIPSGPAACLGHSEAIRHHSLSLACHFRCFERNWKDIHKEQRVSLVFAVRKQSGSRCNQVFNIVPVGLSTHALDKLFKRF